MSCNRRTLCSCWPLVLAALTVGSLAAEAAEPPHEGTSSSPTISQAPRRGQSDLAVARGSARRGRQWKWASRSLQADDRRLSNRRPALPGGLPCGHAAGGPGRLHPGCGSPDAAVERLSVEIRRYLARFEPPKPPPTTPASPAWKHYEPGEEDRWARHESVPIDMMIETLSGEAKSVRDKSWDLHARWGKAHAWPESAKWYPIIGWRPCTENMDVLWNNCAVLLMREKGVAEEILSEPGPHFVDAKWDGRHLWLLTKNGGVRVVSTAGETLHRFGDAEGLPPYEHGVVLHPVSPGVVCMAGSFGEHLLPSGHPWVARVVFRYAMRAVTSTSV